MKQCKLHLGHRMELDGVCAPEPSDPWRLMLWLDVFAFSFFFLERRWQCVDLNLGHSVCYPSSLLVNETASGLLERNFRLRLNKGQLWSK